MRAADHRRAAMLVRTRANGLHEAVEQLQEEIAGLAHLKRLRGVDDIRGRQAEMKPSRRWTDVLGHRGREGDDVVLSGFLDLFDPLDAERRARLDVARGILRHDPGVAIASTAAISTCSQVSYFRWSLQMRPISGLV
jgi:hypothetical protein